MGAARGAVNTRLEGRAAVELLGIGLFVRCRDRGKEYRTWRLRRRSRFVVLRDVPEPSVLVSPDLQDEGGAFILALVTVGALKISPDGPLLQHGVRHAQAEPFCIRTFARSHPRRPWSGSRWGRSQSRIFTPRRGRPRGGFRTRTPWWTRRRARGRSSAASGRTRCGEPARSATIRAACDH